MIQYKFNIRCINHLFNDFYQMILNDHVGKSSCQDLESRDSEAEMPKLGW